jgi:uncharacterized protein (TIGR03435 family)
VTALRFTRWITVRMLFLTVGTQLLCGERSLSQSAAAPPSSAVEKRIADASELSDTKELKFEVVSIKPAAPAEALDERYLPDGFVNTNISISRLILMAFFPQVLWRSDRLKGVPDWAMSDHYDLVAKVSPEDAAEWQKHSGNMLDNKTLQGALQAMLKDRCKLVVHRIPAEISGYDLVLAKHTAGPRSTVAGETFPEGVRLNADGSRSGYIGDLKNNSRKLVYYNTTMDPFVASFSFVIGAPIRNSTGLTGHYDLELKDAWPLHTEDPDLYRGMKPSDRYDIGASGLRLQPALLPSTTLVIDHIEKPSQN